MTTIYKNQIKFKEIKFKKGVEIFIKVTVKPIDIYKVIK